MRSSLARTAITLSLLVALTRAQTNCDRDADCLENQYCYSSGLCANYTICSWFNRIESAVPSRSADQCGPCFEGYFAEKTHNGEAHGCKKNLTVKTEKVSDNIEPWIWQGALIFAVVAASTYVGYKCWHYYRLQCKNNGKRKSKESTQIVAIPMVEMPPCASAPPPSPCQNNNKYEDMMANRNLLPKIGDHEGIIAVDTSRPLKAQGYHPPNYVHIDQTYNAEDSQDNPPTVPPPEIDDETMSSDWTPGQPNAVGSRPFRAITQEQANNSSNDALDRLGARNSGSSTSQEERDNRENNNGSGNSGGGSNGGRNSHGNVNSLRCNVQLQVTNYFNQGGNGS